MTPQFWYKVLTLFISSWTKDVGTYNCYGRCITNGTTTYWRMKSWVHHFIYLIVTFFQILCMYTWSHSKNDCDVTEHAQYTRCKTHPLCVNPAQCSFLNVWENIRVAHAITSVVLRNIRADVTVVLKVRQSMVKKLWINKRFQCKLVSDRSLPL